MTNKEAKKEVIKKAYGENWEKVKEYVDEYGRLTYQQCTDIFGDNEFYFCGISNLWKNDCEGHYAPEIVFDLCRNNGWTRIEPDGSNLPDFDKLQKYKIYDKKIDISFTNNYDWSDLIGRFKSGTATHYKPIKDLKPIY